MKTFSQDLGIKLLEMNTRFRSNILQGHLIKILTQLYLQ